VTRADGQVVDGRVTGTDPDLDVAVVELDTGGAPAITWDPSRLATVGAGLPVFALADPGGTGVWYLDAASGPNQHAYAPATVLPALVQATAAWFG